MSVIMLQHSLIVSLICIAIHIIMTWKGMLLKPVGDWLDLRLNKYIKKPLFTCPMCMASFWTVMYWLYMRTSINEMTFVMMLVVCGINTVLNSAIYYFHEEPEDEECECKTEVDNINKIIADKATEDFLKNGNTNI